MEAIEEELSKKSIERDDDNVSMNIVEADPAVKPPPKPKKARSEKQIAAFEKARITRAKNIALKKTQQKAELKEKKKVIKKKVEQELEKPQVSYAKPLAVSSQVVQHEPSIPAPKQHPSIDRIQAREQVVNNYYYYGSGSAPQEQEPHYEVHRKKTRKSKPKPVSPPTSSSSEEEDIRPPSPPIEPQSYKELQEYNEPVQRPTPVKQNPKYKFSYA